VFTYICYKIAIVVARRALIGSGNPGIVFTLVVSQWPRRTCLENNQLYKRKFVKPYLLKSGLVG